MKPSFVFALVMLIAVIMIASFDLQLSPGEVLPLKSGVDTGQILYVCPATSQSWDSVAHALRPFSKYITIALFSTALMIMFAWGWALYQNMLEDKFKKAAFSKPWAFTKIWLIAMVIIVLAEATPNHFRTVHVRGIATDFVLCESNSPGNQPVKYDAVRG